jgi:hypothetical protein
LRPARAPGSSEPEATGGTPPRRAAGFLAPSSSRGRDSRTNSGATTRGADRGGGARSEPGLPPSSSGQSARDGRRRRRFRGRSSESEGSASRLDGSASAASASGRSPSAAIRKGRREERARLSEGGTRDAMAGSMRFVPVAGLGLVRLAAPCFDSAAPRVGFLER